MTPYKTKPTLEEAAAIIIEHVRAWILPYEPVDSEEFQDYLTLAPALANNPEIDLDELCASVLA